jgi:predicted RNA methylase
MKQYLHIFRYHHKDTELHLLEQKYVFNQGNHEGRHFFSDQIHYLEDSCFGEAVIDIFHFAKEFDDLKDFLVENLPFLENVRLESLTIGFQPKCNFLDLSKFFTCLKLKAKLDNPDASYVLTRTEEGWYFGEKVSGSEKLWNIYRNKPETISSGFPHSMARTVLLCLKSQGAKSIIDYCSGSGTFSIEARSLRLETTAIDLNSTMVEMTKNNLSHYNLAATVIHTSATDFTQTADGGIVDFPYGYHCTRNIDEENQIIQNVIKNTQVSCLIHGEDLTEKIKQAGGELFDKVIIPAVNIKRHLHFIRSHHATL